MQWFEIEAQIEILGAVMLAVRFMNLPPVYQTLEEEGQPGGIQIESIQMEWKKDNSKDWETIDVTEKVTREMYMNILAAIREWQNEPSEPDTDSWPEVA